MRDFTVGSITKKLLIFIFPIVCAHFVQSLYLIIDAIWVGRLIGADSLAAVSTVFPVLFFLNSLLMGLGIAVNTLVGQSYGAKNNRLMEKILKNSFLIILLLSCFISVFGIFFSSFILDLINVPKTIEAGSYIYLVIIMFSLPFRALYNWFASVLRGVGDSRSPLIILFVSVILNITLTPLFIEGLGCFPAMGIAGSALATVFSAFLSTILAYILFVKQDGIFNIVKWKIEMNLAVIKRMFSIGIPGSLNMMVRSTGWIVIIALINNFGADLTAGYGIGMRVDMFAILPAISIGMGISSIAAQNIGVDRFERVRLYLKDAVFLALGLGLFMYTFVNLFGTTIAGIFTTNNAVIENAVGYIRIISFSYFVFAFMFPLQGLIRGAGHTGYLFVFSVISVLIIQLPLAYFLSFHTFLRETGIWIAILSGILCETALCFFYYKCGHWRRRIPEISV
ncbi:MAG: MATE family efflux transporter [Candidatus Omnitrophica bacterium]|nr:MATE family efflux transporter [Candidatus Omnitrophota bacterium]MBD3269191.1 MATE family efflux transporter [Candidatus Omnitrophota bacterium]